MWTAGHERTTDMLEDILIHFVIGLLAAATTWTVRSMCHHKGLLPHPRWQLPLTVFLVAVEAVVTVQIVG